MSGTGSDNGWLEAAVAWEVCASLHRQYCKGKDALFTTRQSDFVKHAENARGRASHGQAPAGATEPTEQQILEAAFAPAQPAVEASRFGSPELQAMIIARCVEKDQADSVQEDAARLDWLEQNLFHREMDEWDVKFGGRGDQNMWVLFAPKGVQGSARRIIDATRKQGEKQ